MSVESNGVISGDVVHDGNLNDEAKVAADIVTLQQTLIDTDLDPELQNAIMNHVLSLVQESYRLGGVSILLQQEEERRRVSGARIGFSAGR